MVSAVIVTALCAPAVNWGGTFREIPGSRKCCCGPKASSSQTASLSSTTTDMTISTVNAHCLRCKPHKNLSLAKRVSLSVVRPRPRIVAGLDVSYASEQFGAATCTAVDIKTGRLLWSETVTRKIGFPYISSFLTFRELPILLDLLDATMTFEPCPDWFLVDGSGIIHPRGAGVATMLGVVAGVPTIGITKKRLFGRVDTRGMRPGHVRAVMDRRRKLGVALRPRTGTHRPLFVSPGHGVSVAAAERVVSRMLLQRRLPEPIYWADRLSRQAARTCAADWSP